MCAWKKPAAELMAGTLEAQASPSRKDEEELMRLKSRCRSNGMQELVLAAHEGHELVARQQDGDQAVAVPAAGWHSPHHAPPPPRAFFFFLMFRIMGECQN